MSRLSALLLIGLCTAGTAFAQGDTLEMTDPSSRFDEPGKPTRGMSQERVASVYGEPQSRESAIGEPPISRWHYDGFIVYFEYDKVIHAVSKR